MSFNIAEQGHVVNILPPISSTAGRTADIFSMKGYEHATIIVQCGTTATAAGTITLEECDDFTPTTDTAIDFYYYAETTAAGDTLGARTKAVAATGVDISVNDNVMYVIELNAAELSADYPCVELKISAPSGATLTSAVAILSGAKYGGDQSPTAIA